MWGKKERKRGEGERKLGPQPFYNLILEVTYDHKRNAKCDVH